MELGIDAQPGPFSFETTRAALVMIDMQRDFLLPSGFGEALGNDVSQLSGCIAPARRLLDWARSVRMSIVHTKEAHAPDLSDCPPAKLQRGAPGKRIGDPGPMGRILIDGEPGSDFLPELAPLAGERVLRKPGKGAFYATDLDDWLQKRSITSLILAGVTTEVCVQTTMREANDRGYNCLLIEEATASYFPHFKRATLEMVRAQGGIVGWTARLGQLIGEGDASSLKANT
ncbi:cysteine hydrolase family protein [Niveibacterium sp.]|uniref:cysteine hydrolase family protein n=1 Tax=Niveibacterium sp. TaxID=2017444 RepID=UPI0035B0CC41